jgi:hypothetical protein
MAASDGIPLARNPGVIDPGTAADPVLGAASQQAR